MNIRLNKPARVSNNTGWHMEEAPGQPPRRVSHNPRLLDTHPEIAAQWHPTKNNSRTPNDVTALSTSKAWWLCQLGHEWERSIRRRTLHESACPECELAHLSLAVTHPQIAKQWSEKNGELKANKVRHGSKTLAWWKCHVTGHDDYQCIIQKRTCQKKPAGCPVCSGTFPERTQSFAALFPDLLKEWHPKLNAEFDPHHMFPGSNISVWWRCVKDKAHEWSAPICHRTLRNPECPYCRRWYITDEIRLSVQFPEIAAEWHPKNRYLWPHVEASFKIASNLRIPSHLKNKNRRLRPSDVAVTCDEEVLWKCKSKGHEWRMSVEARTVHGRGCPTCQKENLAEQESLLALFPPIAKRWHPTRNLPLQPTDLVPGSTKVVYWRCPKLATHVWKAPVYSVVRAWKEGNNGCPWCQGLSVDEKNSLQTKCPEIAKLWHPTKNGSLRPSDVTVKSNKRAWFLCGKPNHEFEAKICNMVLAFERGTTGCKFCSCKAAAPDNCLEERHPEVAKMWHSIQNGDLKPSDVTPKSSKVVSWFCEQGHVWQARVWCMVQSFGSSAKGCPYCYGKKPSKDNNLLAKYPDVAKFWDPKRNLPWLPSQVLPRSHKRFYWRCVIKGHQWQAVVNNVVVSFLKNREVCPSCRAMD